MKKIIGITGLLLFCAMVWSQTYIDMRKPIRMVYGGDTLIFSFSGDTVILYSNHKNFRAQDLLKIKQLVLSDSVVTKIMPDTLVNPAFVRGYVLEHGVDGVFANTGVYKDEDTIKLTNSINYESYMADSTNGIAISLNDANRTGIMISHDGSKIQTYIGSITNYPYINISDGQFDVFLNDSSYYTQTTDYVQISAKSGSDLPNKMILSNGKLYVGEDDLIGSDSLEAVLSYQNKSIYGSMYAHNITQVVDIIATDQMKSIPGGFTEGLSIGWTMFSLQGDSALVCHVEGYYLVNYSISAQVTSGEEWESAVMVNGVMRPETSAHSESTQGATTRPQVNSGTGIIDLQVGDIVTLGVDNHVSSGNVTVFHANITLLKLHF